MKGDVCMNGGSWQSVPASVIIGYSNRCFL